MLRRCYLNLEGVGEKRNCLFDSWVTVDEVRITTRRENAGTRELRRVLRAIVIFDNGTVFLADPNNIVFNMEELQND